MKKLGVRKPIVLLLAIGIIALLGAGAAAWWSAQQTITGNQIGSGHMGIEMPYVQSLNVAGLMPGQYGTVEYTVINPAGNPAVDLAFVVDNVAGELANDVQLAFFLTTAPNSAFWLKSDGTAAAWSSGQETGTNWLPFADFMSAYNNDNFNTGAAFLNLAEYQNIPAGVAYAPGILSSERHIKVFYILPENCAADSHDQTATFDMTFELIQHHG